MNALKTLSLLVILSAALGLLVATPVSARNLCNTKVPLCWTILDPCTQDSVALKGTIHILINGTITPSGHAHLKIHLNAQNIQGEGLQSGRKYHGNGAANLTVNTVFCEHEPLVINGVVNAHLISQGSEDNLMIKIKLHITVNANGDITACMAGFEAECE